MRDNEEERGFRSALFFLIQMRVQCSLTMFDSIKLIVTHSFGHKLMNQRLKFTNKTWKFVQVAKAAKR